MFRLPVKVYGAKNNLKKFNVIKNWKKILKFEIFFKSSPTRHIKNKAIDFAPSIKSIMANKLPQPIWNDF